MTGPVEEAPEGFSLFGRDLFGDPIKPQGRGPLAARYEFPPFSVLSAREGEWQARKRAWIDLGIKSELGRGEGIMGFSEVARNKYAKPSPTGFKKYYGTTFATADWFAEKGLTGAEMGNTSIFDPVLCELAYRWFCPPGGMILDPFAGGSVRGIVAGLLGFQYHGIELRAEQVAANESQRSIIPGEPVAWVCGDSIDELPNAPLADFVFSCPPYGDLEVYSDDPRDISGMEYNTFIPALKRIVMRACERLKPNRFACFVVGDFRDPKTGLMRGFVNDTVNAFREQGLGLYNEAVLVTAVGSLPIRVGKQFAVSRKLGKTHQNILVFVKGDPRKATDAIVGQEELPLE